jgi:prepilin-type N-terminal cleavage/methylation domain-containing protein
MIMKNEKGFSLLEMLITMSIFMVVLSGVYLMVIHYGDVSQNEHSRRRMEQESRFLTTNFAAELKNAGSVLTLANTSTFLSAVPYFNGIFPLNMDNEDMFPDGVIIAAGDPEAVTQLSVPFTPDEAGENAELNVNSTTVLGFDALDPLAVPPWSVGDKGIILGTDGYYVFSVAQVNPASLTLRDAPVYYSGLLNTMCDLGASKSYVDPPDAANPVTGDAVTYPVNAPVIRLANFGIYLFKEARHPKYYAHERTIRQFIKITDTMGAADPLASGSDADMSIISESIYDMQITYTGYTNFAAVTPDTTIDLDHYYFASNSSGLATLENLLTDIRAKNLKRLNVTIVALSDDFDQRTSVEVQAPAMGDQPQYDMPPGDYTFKILTLEIEPRNYNIVL